MQESILNHLLEELRAQGARLDELNSTMVRNTASLEEHVKRTNMLEQEIKPIQDHVRFISNLAKGASIGGAILLFGKQMGFF